MDQKFKQFLNSLRQITLRSEEKLAMRERLAAQMKASGLIQPAPARTGWSHFEWRLALMPLVAVLIIGGTISSAAERALPGQFLYPVKLKVNESLGRLFTGSSPEEVLTHETGLLEKRLEEAERLDSLNKLDQDNELKAEIKSRVMKQQDKVSAAWRLVEPELEPKPESKPEPKESPVMPAPTVAPLAKPEPLLETAGL